MDVVLVLGVCLICVLDRGAFCVLSSASRRSLEGVKEAHADTLANHIYYPDCRP